MKRRLWQISAALAVLLILIVAGGVLVLRSSWFLEQVRLRIVDEAQRATGAKVELGSVTFDWRTMLARVDSLTLHGKESAEEPPLLRLSSATLGLRIISAFERKVDLRSLRIENPQVRVVVYPDGTTNIPGPDARPQRLWTEDLLNLKIGEYEVVNGVVEYDNRVIPWNVRGRNLNARMTYDAAIPAYRGELSSDGLRIVPPGYDPVDSSIQVKFALERNRVHFDELQWSTGQLTANISGTLDDLRAPHGTLAVRASTPLREIVREFRLPVDPSGTVRFDGDVTVAFAEEFDYSARGRITMQGLRYVKDRIRIENAAVRGAVQLTRNGVTLRQLTAQALGATITGDAELAGWKNLRVSGDIAGLNLRRAAEIATPRPVPWNGTLNGKFEASMTLDRQNAIARTTLSIVPAEDGEAIAGHVDAVYDQAKNTLAFGSSSIETGATRLELEGTLGETLRVRARTTRLEDLNPLLEFAEQAQTELPLKLENGSISLDGTVTGELENPRFQGQVAVTRASVRGFFVDRFAANMDASKTQIAARNIDAARGQTTATGSGFITRENETADFAQGAIAAQLALRNVDVAETARELKIPEPVAGVASANVRVNGTLDRPEATVTLDVANPAGLGERADRLRGNIRYQTGLIEISDGVLVDAGSEVRFAGSYRHPENDLRSGDLGFQASTQNLPTARIERLAAVKPTPSAIVSGQFQGTGTLRNGVFSLTSTTANATARQITVNGERIGDATLTAETQGTDLTVRADAGVRESRVNLTGAWKLEGEAPGSAQIRFSRIGVNSVQDLVMLGTRSTPPSVDGFVEGEASLTLSLQKPRDFRAEVRLSTVQVSPRENPAPRLGLTPEDVIVRGNGPVVLAVTQEGATVRSARFTGRNTEMELSGDVPFTAEADANLSVRGNIDMVILQLFRSDLQAVGVANVNATIRGSLKDPNVNGQLSFADAQLYLEDLPNGIDKAAGTILFDRRRATIQQLTADTGGGQIGLTGFVEFGETLLYRLQARARRVRVRYPQDVSTTFDADLSLNGTSQDSRLTGNVSLTRSAFMISTDLGQLLEGAADPTPVEGEENEYLSGMQLDVRITNGPNFQLETSLSSNVEADVDLRLRGTPSRPVLLGSVNINRGVFQVFGNQYTLERGDIRFVNAVKIEPTVDLDLSTRARGVLVNISLSGTPDKITPNYSSDPPLQTSEIFALLAMGRDPASSSSQLAPGASRGSNAVLGAGSNLVGQALSAQMSNQAQRFFGASRVKIDPTLTGVDNTPQARLTWEQQVSKDITLTYITNLTRTQEQIVRVQWDFSRDWSAIAVRDANGMFGLDFQFRKRFK